MQASSSAAAASQQSASEPLRSPHDHNEPTRTILKFVIAALGAVPRAGRAVVPGTSIDFWPGASYSSEAASSSRPSPQGRLPLPARRTSS